jgi:hypothetical protein
MAPKETEANSRAAAWIVPGLAAAKFIFHLATANRYGIFRDEMYVIACARHLDWGYISHPPGGIVIGWLAEHVFGDTLLGLRLLPAAAGAALVWLSGTAARALGGGPFAQGLAALAIFMVPIYALMDHWLTMNAFEPLLWLGCLLCVLRAERTGADRWWIAFGVLVGIGIEFKYSIIFLAAGILVGLALGAGRRHLARASLWIGLLLGALVALLNFVWQARHGFPFLVHERNVHFSHRDIVRGPIAFLADQAFIMQPLLAPLWAAGAAWLILGKDRRQTAALGWAFLFVLGAFIALHGKNYYPTPVYPVALAAGAVLLERASAPAGRRWVRVAYAGAVAVGGVALLPLVSPVLSPEAFLRYEARLGLTPPAAEYQNNGLLPQYFADEFGWEDMVREVARVYHSLTPEEQAKTALFSNGWGEAAAVDFFGPKYGLPPAISKDDSYWTWGPRDYTGEIMIILRTDGSGDRQHFASVVKAGRVDNRYARRDECFDIYLCRGLNEDLRTLWPSLQTTD